MHHFFHKHLIDFTTEAIWPGTLLVRFYLLLQCLKHFFWQSFLKCMSFKGSIYSALLQLLAYNCWYLLTVILIFVGRIVINVHDCFKSYQLCWFFRNTFYCCSFLFCLFLSFLYNLYYFFFLLPFLFLAPHVEFRWVFCFILQSFKATPIPLQSTNLNMFTS